ncbi:MAG TPA: peptide chain release factor N(5)-glutamine methyltransferase [Candidatus Nanopelagicaceae bacterium]|nr:peptide chain release factor N(5)-glutamine methyltransferase [Candidatus Nanopelagicaceae bacterium]
MSPSIRVHLADAAHLLASAGLQSPRVDAELIAAHVLDTSRGGIWTYDHFSSVQVEIFDSLVAARSKGVPLQYLLGAAPFRQISLLVGPGVLIPRPETESVAQQAIELAREISAEGSTASCTVVDLGAGSGAIAISIGLEAPGSRVFAVELEKDAYVWLARNVSALAPTVEIVNADVESALPDLNGVVDIVVANPPYVPTALALPAEITNFEPPAALWGGNEDGTVVPAKFIAAAARLLREDGWLICEHSDTHAPQIAELMAVDFHQITLHHDLNDRPRWTSGRRKVGR